MRFSIVTPVMNGARFIDDTIDSVVSQAGPFSIRYRVQDGGSTDNTLDKLARWQTMLRGKFPARCDGIEFSYASARDNGMYGAINAGFERCGDSDVMAWINADDFFAKDAFSSVAQIFASFPDVHWLGGRRAALVGGRRIITHSLDCFPRSRIAAGKFDGRRAVHIQQEGSFWRPSLWQTVGGLNPDFRLAGDFDLWRRFAQHAELVIAEEIFAYWRQHRGQLSADRTAYNAEVDVSLARPMRLPPERPAQIAVRDGDRWRLKRYEPPPPSALARLWSLRRYLPAFFSVRGLSN